MTDSPLTTFDVPASEYSWDVKAQQIYQALLHGEAVPGWRLTKIDDQTAIEKMFDGRWPTDEP